MVIKIFIKYLLIYIFFISFLISFKNLSRNFNEDVLCFVAFVAFAAFVGSVAVSFATSDSVADSGVSSRVAILSRFFLEIICS